MQARQLPFQRGWAWLRDGFLLWRKNPALMTLATFGYLLSIVLVSALPLIGQPIASMLMPVLSLGVLNACRAIENRTPAGPEILFSGFRDKKKLPALFMVGGLYLVGSLLVFGATMLFDDGTLLAILKGEFDPETDTFELANVMPALLVAIGLSTPVMMAYWFAPILVGWWGVSAPKAMFFSFVACARNWRSFLGFAIALMVVGCLVPGLVLGIVGAIVPLIASLLVAAMPLVLLPILFASFYRNAREVFEVRTVDETIDD